MDSISAVLVNFSYKNPKLIDRLESPYSEQLQNRLENLIKPYWKGSLDEISSLDHLVGQAFGTAARTLISRNPLSLPKAIGSHGQTIWHAPDSTTPSSWQIGDPNIIAEETRTTTISDWRRRDMAAGGQGAPLVPAFHKAMFQDTSSAAVLNLGGIANLTILPSEPHLTRGFDTGPANTLSDSWSQHKRGLSFDAEGAWANNGTKHTQLLNRMLQDPYFQRLPPKSTGREHFNIAWLEKQLKNVGETIHAQDVQATIVELTAVSIKDSLTKEAPNTQNLYVCGGGIHNTHLMQRLSAHMPAINILSTKEKGIDPDLVEAMAFAWLAKKTLDHQPGNIPAATGSSGPRILGGIYLAHLPKNLITYKKRPYQEPLS